MLLHIPGLFSREEVQRIRQALENADWADGKITAGHQSLKAKHNLQLPERPPSGQGNRCGDAGALVAEPVVYVGGVTAQGLPAVAQLLHRRRQFDFHIDNAVRQPKGSHERVRTDLCHPPCFSATPMSTTAASWRSRTPSACGV